MNTKTVKKQPIIKINPNETENPIENKKLIELKNEILLAHKNKSVLCEKIIKVENNTNMKEHSGAKYSAVLFYKGYKIIIPISEMGFELSKLPVFRSSVTKEEISKDIVFKKFLGYMLGAEIDFVILKVDVESKICVASRKIAMLKKRTKYWTSTDDKVSIMQSAYIQGLSVEGRITSVTANSLRVEVFGVEGNVMPKDIAYRYLTMQDIGTKYPIGSVVNMKISELDIDSETGEIAAKFSIKNAEEDSRLKNIKSYQEGDVVMGRVSNITEKAYFVAVGNYDTGIDVWCKYVEAITLPNLNDTVSVEIRGINYEEGRAYGCIMRIIVNAS